MFHGHGVQLLMCVTEKDCLCFSGFSAVIKSKQKVSAMHGAYITAVLFFNCKFSRGVEDLYARAAGDLLRGVDVPQFAFAGGQATLSCSYDLRSTRLYSLKWYHNGTEFYRYVPTERNRPINIQPSLKFSVTELFRNEHRVTLSLTRLTVSASGQYRCEVIAEHPSFRTEASMAFMTVLREPLAPPVLVGAREIYEPTEMIKIGCQPRPSLYDGHTPVLQWFLEGSQVGSEFVTPYGNALRDGDSGLSLHVPGEQIAAAGGTLQAECRLTLGPHTLSAYKTLRVRVRMISYVGTYHSPANQWEVSIVCLLMGTAAVLLLL
ncbi:uncharacterized protein LOC121868604 [Homarus americanus]|uniref:uncharacterized protein LOC121868604 n=1 Tax=Homarus americanus TaxID=6706 RepID=UPI001C46AC4F|nr:uncharacterized protein LOC121868604 [Homarus americanus]